MMGIGFEVFNQYIFSSYWHMKSFEFGTSQMESFIPVTFMVVALVDNQIYQSSDALAI